MTFATAQLPFQATIAPSVQAGVAEAVRAAHDAGTPMYPFGGRTALDYGIAPTPPGTGLDLADLARVVDYTPRDMTIVVEAGARMADLADTLAAEGQHLPIDVPRAAEATIGGVVATNWNGPRRLGYGTVRDYVIGIHAVDGRGVAFKGGGRVVKNVAGYDFCKLLCGSLGTLGVITQLALKVKPQPEQSATVITESPDLAAAERMLGRLAQLEAVPAAIDLLTGDGWPLQSTVRSPQSAIRNRMLLAVRVEGTEPEVAWLADRVRTELRAGGGTSARLLDENEAAALWVRQVEFADRGPNESADDAPMAVKIAVPPSATTSMVAAVLDFDRAAAVQAHAASGIVLARFLQFNASDLTGILVSKLRPAAVQLGGSLVILSSTLEGLTPHVVWGGRTEANVLAERVRKKFDPRGILNPGRFPD